MRFCLKFPVFLTFEQRILLFLQYNFASQSAFFLTQRHKDTEAKWNMEDIKETEVS